MGRCRGYESRHRIFWNSVRLALKQQVRDLAKSEREKVIRRGEALESSVLGKTGNEVGYPGTEQKNKRPGRGHRTGYGEPCPHASISCASHQLLPPPPHFPPLQEGMSREFLRERQHREWSTRLQGRGEATHKSVRSCGAKQRREPHFLKAATLMLGSRVWNPPTRRDETCAAWPKLSLSEQEGPDPVPPSLRYLSLPSQGFPGARAGWGRKPAEVEERERKGWSSVGELAPGTRENGVSFRLPTPVNPHVPSHFLLILHQDIEVIRGLLPKLGFRDGWRVGP